MKVLGLDISTSIVGIAIIDDSNGTMSLVHFEHVDLTKCSSFWEKVDLITDHINVLSKKDVSKNINYVGVEEALVSFRTGMSSAQTITTLVAFNAVVRYVLRQIFTIEPQTLPSQTARKKAGVKVLSKSKCGISVKDQVFQHMCKNDLSHITWPRKKSTIKNPNPDVKDYAKDITDAYVVAKALYVIQFEQKT